MLLTTIVGSGVVILDGTVVNIALPHIARELGASFAQLQWIVDGYLLSLSSLILIGGSLGDILGRKRIYYIGLIGFGITSLLCGLAPNIEFLIGIRVVQGIFGAMLVPGGLAIVNTNFPAELRGKAIGTWTAWSSITTAIGPPLGGWIVDNASWRWIFFINVPLIALCMWLGKKSVEESRDEGQRTIDYLGAALAAVALGGTTYGLIEGPIQHWSTRAITALAVGVVAIFAFLYVESHASDPMVKLSLFKSRNFTAANAATFAMYGALSGFIFAFVIYLQSSVGYSGIKAGVSLLPVTFLMLTLSGRVGALCARFGPRFFMTVGPIVQAMGMVLLLHLNSQSSYLTTVLPGVVLFGIGLALTVAPLTVTVMGSVSDKSSGIASGINNAVARAAGLIVISVVGIYGASNAYKFTLTLCASLVLIAGVLSFFLVQNKVKKLA